MKSIYEITDTIAECIRNALMTLDDSDIENVDDYDVKVCTERIFVDDYVSSMEGNSVEGIPENPDDDRYRNTIFVVIKFGQGQNNHSVLNVPVTIECLSEKDDFEVASKMLSRFCEIYNFEYTDGIVMSFYTPSVSSSAENMYGGFRALMHCNGTVKVADDGLMFVTSIWSVAELDDGNGGSKKVWFRIPFINVGDNWNPQSDPQCFGAFGGRTFNLNRQSTTTGSFSCYMWNMQGDDEQSRALNWFSRMVLSSKYHMNQKYYLYMMTNVFVKEGEAGFEKEVYDFLVKNGAPEYVVSEDEHGYYMPQAEGWFTLSSRAFSQAWGDITPHSISFTESLEKETWENE